MNALVFAAGSLLALFWAFAVRHVRLDYILLLWLIFDLGVAERYRQCLWTAQSPAQGCQTAALTPTRSRPVYTLHEPTCHPAVGIQTLARSVIPALAFSSTN